MYTYSHIIIAVYYGFTQRTLMHKVWYFHTSEAHIAHILYTFVQFLQKILFSLIQIGNSANQRVCAYQSAAIVRGDGSSLELHRGVCGRIPNDKAVLVLLSRIAATATLRASAQEAPLLHLHRMHQTCSSNRGNGLCAIAQIKSTAQPAARRTSARSEHKHPASIQVQAVCEASRCRTTATAHDLESGCECWPKHSIQR